MDATAKMIIHSYFILFLLLWLHFKYKFAIPNLYPAIDASVIIPIIPNKIPNATDDMISGGIPISNNLKIAKIFNSAYSKKVNRMEGSVSFNVTDSDVGILFAIFIL